MDNLHFISNDELEDDKIKAIYKKVMEDDPNTPFFASWGQHNEEIFLNYARASHFTVMILNKKLAAFVFVNEIFTGVGSVSYYGFDWVRGKHTVMLGKEYLKQMIKNVSVLVGLTPITNPLAIRFNEMIGMTKLCVIPKSVYIAKENKYVDGVLTYIN